MKFKVTKIANGYILTWVYLNAHIPYEDMFFESFDDLFLHLKNFDVALSCVVSEKNRHEQSRETKPL